MNRLNSIPFAVVLIACLTLAAGSFHSAPDKKGEPMQLGVFSVSLAVKDIAASKAFYEKLGFVPVGGNQEHNWLVLQNDTTTIGLFQGMFEGNILTFNPGWNRKKEPLESFQDVREIQARLKDSGLTLTTEADESTSGPASFTLVDPDGNAILFDQHVPRAEK
jgi:catechol 2,3-dioxygenase-like lactoylglutathione lyase family enzyme